MHNGRNVVPTLLALGSLLAPMGAFAAGAPSGPTPESLQSVRVLIRNGYYFAAESSARVIMDQARVSPGKDSLRFADAGELLVDALWRLARVEPQHVELAESVRRIRERAFGAESPEHASAIMGLGDAFRIRNQLPAARACYERALTIREHALGPEHPDVASSLTWAARVQADSSDLAAKPRFERALSIREKALPQDDPDRARAYFWMGWSLRRCGQLKAAKEMLERAIALQEKILRPGHPDLGTTLHHYGICLRQMNDLRGARPILERALEIREGALGPMHLDVGWTLWALGQVAANTGDFDRGREQLERAIEIFRSPPCALPQAEGETHGSLGYLLTEACEFREARRELDLAIAELTMLRGPDDDSVVGAVESLGNLFLTMGDFGSARRCFERARAAHERRHGAGSPRLSYHDLKLGNTALGMREYARAETLLGRSVTTKERAYGPHSPDLAAPLLYLGQACIGVGDLEQGRIQLERSRQIEDSTQVHGAFGPYGTTMSLAKLDHLMGHEAVAREGFRRAIALSDRVRGPNDMNTGDALADYADFLVEAGPIEATLDTALLAETVSREHLRLTARGLSEEQALIYASNRGTGLPAALTLAARGLDGAARARVWDAVIRSRALVLDEMAARRRGLGGGPKAQALKMANERLAKLAVRGPGDDVAGYREELTRAREAKEHAERELGESAEASRDLASDSIGFADVAIRLPPGSALVAYVAYDHREHRTPALKRAGDAGVRVPPEKILPITPRYLAFVLRGGERTPEVVPLGSQAGVDSLAGRWGEQASHGMRSGRVLREADYRPAGEGLRRAVWDPVAARIGKSSRVFVVPDGALNLVNLTTLPAAGGGYLVESGPLLHLLTTERDLAAPERTAAGAGGLLAMGGADFDGARPPAAAVSEPGRAAQFRGARSSCPDFQNIRWARLPGTLSEVNDVAATWNATLPAGAPDRGPSGGATVLTGAEADEDALKERAGGARVLHLATHGFFLDGRCVPAYEGSRGLGSLVETPAKPVGGPAPAGAQSAAAGRESTPALRENPLLLSGIVLAGANYRQEAGSDEEDGVVTAEEISSLDLAGVEWAVLSACETGVGEVRSGEGVFGLRRAFRVAGARTTIMSLWSVDDEATRAWMHALYTARLRDKLGTAEAVRAASRAVLRERRARGESTHPFFWGAFVAAGDWR